jgi:hypothetical protein
MLGIGTSLKIDDGGSPPVPTEVANWCMNIDFATTVDEVEATTYQPGVPNPVKMTETGFTNSLITLTVKYSDAAWLFFTGIAGLIGLAFAYCPGGEVPGKAETTGVCDVHLVGDPKAAPLALSSFEVQLRCTSRTPGTFTT